eukprot:5992912-Prymnesium_polylepis.1
MGAPWGTMSRGKIRRGDGQANQIQMGHGAALGRECIVGAGCVTFRNYTLHVTHTRSTSAHQGPGKGIRAPHISDITRTRQASPPIQHTAVLVKPSLRSVGAIGPR